MPWRWSRSTSPSEQPVLDRIADLPQVLYVKQLAF